MRMIIAAALLAAGCSGDKGAGDDTGGAEAADSYTLAVAGGYGAGTYAPGEVVDVWSAHVPAGDAFFGWEGDTDALESAAEWHTRLVMPAADVSLQASFSPAPALVEQRPYSGASGVSKTARYLAIDGEPAAVLLLLHGTSANSEIIESIEGIALARAAAARGWLVLAPEAEETGGDLDGDGVIRWDTVVSTSNIDLKNTEALLAQLEGDLFPPGVPLYAAGMSNGGTAATALGRLRGDSALESAFPRLSQVSAAASICAVGMVSPGDGLPVGWYMASQDASPEVGAEGNAQAADRSADLADAGIPTDFASNPPSPLYPERFTRLPGIDAAKSQAIWGELLAHGYLAEDGTVLQDPSAIREEFQADPESFPELRAVDAVAALGQVEAAYAAHELYSDYAARAVAFLESAGQ